MAKSFPMLIVNNEPVDPSLIEDAFQRIKTTAEMLTEVSCCERDGEFYAEAEQEVIDGILLAQEAERRHPQINDSVFRPAFEQVLRQWRENGASWELIEAHTLQIRQETTATLRMELFTQELFADVAEPTQEEIAEFYEAHREDYFIPPAAHALHLIRFADRSQAWQDFSLLVKIRDDVNEGKSDFAELARLHTQKKSGDIDLNWITMERPTNAFEAVLFSLRERECSPVLSYDNALHLVYPLEVKVAVQIPLEEKKEEIAQLVTRRKKQAVLRALASTLRETAVVSGTRENC
jgi:hypothetical protein